MSKSQKNVSIIAFAFSFCILLCFFLWGETHELSLEKKINSEKVSAFFTALGSVATALTVFLLYKQIEEQIKDRRAASQPDLYPVDQFFKLELDKSIPMLTREKTDETLSGLISIHNIGLGTAKEIVTKWSYNKNLLGKLLDGEIKKILMSEEPEDSFSFVSANSKLDIQLPLIFIASFTSYKKGWTITIWEELYLEITYRDIHDFQYKTRIFKANVYVSSNFVRIEFKKADCINISTESTIHSPFILK